MLKLAVIDPHVEDSAAFIQKRSDPSFMSAQKTVFDLISWSTFRTIMWELNTSKEKVFEIAVLPLKRNFILKPQYWLCVLAMFFIHSERKYFIGSGGDIKEFYGFLARATFIVQPLITIGIILRLPYYTVKQVVRHFMLTPEKKEDEIVGFGQGKAVNGIIYWLTITKKAKRYGVFGLAQDTYMGQPLGIHNWPLAVSLLEKFGFRRYIYVSVILFAIGFGWLCLSTGHHNVMWLMPLIFLSPYFFLNISSGTWEPLAWGLAALSFAAFNAHLAIFSAIFLALILLTHPGVTFLTCILLGVFTIIDQRPLIDPMFVYFLFTVLSVWWLIPYRKASSKLGRDCIINKFWSNSLKWGLPSLYQAGIFLLFLCTALITGTNKILACLLILPLIFLYYNTKIKWVFSGYTMTNFMLFTGALYLAIQPTLLAVIAYLLVIYTSNSMLWLCPGESIWGFDLTPVTFNKKRHQVLEAFKKIRDGRVAFEMSKNRDDTWDVLASLGYILSDTGLELFNVGYAEIGDHHIFEKHCQYFNLEANQEQFETACQSAGIQYFVSFSSDFSKELSRRGYDCVVSLENVCLSPLPNAAPITLTIFKLPWTAAVIEPATAIEVTPNSIRFQAKQGERYLLKYSAFKGWHARQGQDRLVIEDANPGMLIQSLRDGEVELKYSLFNYYS